MAFHYQHSQSKAKLGQYDGLKEFAVDELNDVTRKQETKRPVEVTEYCVQHLNFYQISQFFPIKIALSQQAHTHEISVKKEALLVQDHRIGECP